LRWDYRHTVIVLFCVLVAMFLASISVGRYTISLETVLKIFFIGERSDSTATLVIFNVRLPRVIAAIAVGATLAATGAAFQGLFKNPLVSSYQLGVSSGAGFGAALAIIMGASTFFIQSTAFLFGIIAVGASFAISRIYKGSSTLTLVLAGIIVGSFFSALVSLMQYIADPRDTLPSIVFWLMGSLASTTATNVIPAIIIMLAGVLGLVLVRWRINILAMGEDEARSLGINLKVLVGLVVTCGTIATASAVCISGVIGWVGLVIPHISRMLVGPDYKKLIPVSILIGGIYLMIIDDIARTLIAGEIPLGILTAIVGTPFFAYLLSKSKASWS
jgi:iron complex transport system permease protein